MDELKDYIKGDLSLLLQTKEGFAGNQQFKLLLTIICVEWQEIALSCTCHRRRVVFVVVVVVVLHKGDQQKRRQREMKHAITNRYRLHPA